MGLQATYSNFPTFSAVLFKALFMFFSFDASDSFQMWVEQVLLYSWKDSLKRKSPGSYGFN